MNDHNDVNEIVQIDFEVGHSSIIRSEPTTIHTPPRTHDWKLFLRSADIDGDLSCLIDRCIFHLHPEFPNHKRELKTTPFAIQETGYAGFLLPIEIYFKTKTEPRKFSIDYVLDLHKNADGHPYRQKESFLQKYRFTFCDPDLELRQKILAAGGKIADSGPIKSKKTDFVDGDKEEGVINRQSPPHKRSASPVSLANGIIRKKVKLEQSTTSIKKKSMQSAVKNDNINPTSINNKKTNLVSHKSSSVLEGKVPKNLSTKESNPAISINPNIESKTNSRQPLDPPSSKPRTSTKLIKSQSTNDIKSSTVSIVATKKKKESVPSPSKTKLVINTQTELKKPMNKIPRKTSVKPGSTSNLAMKSPLNTIVKQEPSSQLTSTSISSNNSISSVPINTLKKIPKKTVPVKVEDKRSRSLIPSSSSSLNRKSSIPKDTQKQATKPSTTTKSNLKRDHSLSSGNISSNTNERSRKTKLTKDLDQVSSSRNEQSKPPTPAPPKSTQNSPQSHIDPPTNSTTLSPTDASQSSMPTPSSVHMLPNEDYLIQTPMDIDGENSNQQTQLSDESNSPREPISIQHTEFRWDRNSYSDQSDTNESDISTEEDHEEQDLPTSLTNDDLRYKLIYIYKRFQLNSINDLSIFVQFFKRHQLIDISSLTMTKSTNEMFTYDLFSLSPLQIGELATDLGYTTMNMTDAMT